MEHHERHQEHVRHLYLEMKCEQMIYEYVGTWTPDGFITEIQVLKINFVISFLKLTSFHLFDLINSSTKI